MNTLRAPGRPSFQSLLSYVQHATTTETRSRDTLRSMGEPVRIPKNVLDDLESVRRYSRVEVLDIPTLRYVAMETHKPALVSWIDRHERDYGRGLLDGFRAGD